MKETDSELEEYSEEERAVMVGFTEALVRGERPVLEAHLARCPAQAERLRPVLETAVWFCGLVQEFKQAHPGFSVWDLFSKGGEPAGRRITV